MNEQIKQIMENAYKIKEDFIKAYLAQEYINNKELDITKKELRGGLNEQI